MQPPVPTSKPVGKPTTIYHVDPLTNELTGSAIADLDPIEQKALIPAYATATAPPKTMAAGSIAVFDEVAATWSQSIDLRGKVYDTSTGEPSTHDKLGTLPKNLTALKPALNQSWDSAKNAWVDDLAKFRTAKVGQLKTGYQIALDAGVTYRGALFQSDAKSIATLSETLTAVANGWILPTGFEWIDTNNTPHPADIAFLKSLSAAFARHKSALFSRLFAAKNKITAATTVTAVNAVIL